MKRYGYGMGMMLLALAIPALAKDPDTHLTVKPTTTPPHVTTAGDVPTTPEMWFYQQYQTQYHNPAEMIRERADYKANQRLARLTSLRWYGLSNQRPQVAVDPLHGGEYGAGWVSNNTAYPYRWQPGTTLTIVQMGKE